MNEPVNEPVPLPAEQPAEQPAEMSAVAGGAPTARVDLDRIEADLGGGEQALSRLDDGTYWIDEITGEAIPDETLAVDPLARRASG